MDYGAQQRSFERYVALEKERDGITARLAQGRREMSSAKTWLNKVAIQLARDEDRFDGIAAEMYQMKRRYIASHFAQGAPPPPLRTISAPLPTISAPLATESPSPPPPKPKESSLKQRRLPQAPRIRLKKTPPPLTFHPDENKPHLPPIAERPGLIPNPNFSPANPLQHVIQPGSEKRINLGGVTMCDQLSCIVLLDEAWHEVWCRFCGANFTSCNRSHQGGKQGKSFILGISGLVGHFRQKHKDEIVHHADIGISPTELVAQHKLSKNEVRSIRSGKMTVKKVPTVTRNPTLRTSGFSKSPQKTEGGNMTPDLSLDPGEKEMLRAVDRSDEMEEAGEPSKVAANNYNRQGGSTMLTSMNTQAIRAINDVAPAEVLCEAAATSDHEMPERPICNSSTAGLPTPLSVAVPSIPEPGIVGPILLPAIVAPLTQTRVNAVKKKRKASGADLDLRDGAFGGNSSY